jgi:hypothetical protein
MKTFIKKEQTVSDSDKFEWKDRGYDLRARLHVDGDLVADDFGEGCHLDLNDKEYGEQNQSIKNALDSGWWQYYWVEVECNRCGVELGTATLSGIEGNFDYAGRTNKDGEEDHTIDNTYFNEVISDLADEAMDEAKKKIFELQATLLNL